MSKVDSASTNMAQNRDVGPVPTPNPRVADVPSKMTMSQKKRALKLIVQQDEAEQKHKKATAMERLHQEIEMLPRIRPFVRPQAAR
jgi:hypothetical protein